MFYAFPDISGLGLDGEGFCRWALDAAGVVLTPGSAFGPGVDGHGRLSFATEPAVLDDAIERIAAAVPALAPGAG